MDGSVAIFVSAQSSKVANGAQVSDTIEKAPKGTKNSLKPTAFVSSTPAEARKCI